MVECPRRSLATFGWTPADSIARRGCVEDHGSGCGAGRSAFEIPKNVKTDQNISLWILIPAGGHIQFSEALPGAGDAVYHLACEAGLEGIVSKRLDSVYRSGPTMNWRKIKCYVEKEMDIIGVKRESDKPAMVLMADHGCYKGGAFVTFKADKATGPMGSGRSKGRRAPAERPCQGKGPMAAARPRRPRKVPEGRREATPCHAQGLLGEMRRLTRSCQRCTAGLSLRRYA